MFDTETVFLDTCVWIELLVVSTPTQSYQKAQASLASNLMKDLTHNKVKIVTCEHQLLELINAILKAKKNEFNRKIKKIDKKGGVSSPKELRVKYPNDFKNGVGVCRMAVNSIKELTLKVDNANVSVDNILNNLEFVDINDYIYYEYCKKNAIKLYTFDLELKQLDDEENTVILLK